MATNFSKAYLNEATADVRFLFRLSADAADTNGDRPAHDLFAPAPKVTIEYVPAHKIILGVASPVFHAMLYGGAAGCTAIEIADVAIDAFRQFLQFAYLMKPQLTLEHAADVLCLADKYDMPKCTAACWNFLKPHINAEHALTIYALAQRHNERTVQRMCATVIVANADRVLASSAFLGCARDVKKNVLALEPVAAQLKFAACMRWSSHECDQLSHDPADMRTRRTIIADCFDLIDFNAMDANELYACIDRYGGLFSHDEVCGLLKSTLKRSGDYVADPDDDDPADEDYEQSGGSDGDEDGDSEEDGAEYGAGAGDSAENVGAGGGVDGGDGGDGETEDSIASGDGDGDGDDGESGDTADSGDNFTGSSLSAGNQSDFTADSGDDDEDDSESTD